MQFIDAKAKDVCGLFEISLSDMKKIKLALDHTEFVVPDDDPGSEIRGAVEHVAGKFYNDVKEAIETMSSMAG